MADLHNAEATTDLDSARAMAADLDKGRTAAAAEPAVTGFALTRFNALRHGVLSKHTVLPWEDPGEYGGLLEALVAEHRPNGPTEEHLVEELAGVVWRKRRLRLGENAAHHHALARHALNIDVDAVNVGTAEAALIRVAPEVENASVVDALTATKEKTAADRKLAARQVPAIKKALRLLEIKSSGTYSRALAALGQPIRSMWEQNFYSDESAYRNPDENLKRFLQNEALPWCEQRQREYDHRSLIREQALGDAVSPPHLEGFARYEVHLDRKFERVLSMLLKLQQMRGASKAPSTPIPEAPC